LGLAVYMWVFVFDDQMTLQAGESLSWAGPRSAISLWLSFGIQGDRGNFCFRSPPSS
jgi:hypothetical protein